MDLFIYIVLSFIIIYLISYFILVRKADKNNRKIPVEVTYLIRRYNIDLKDINYKRFLNQVSIIGSIDMTIAVTVMLFINNIILQFVVGFIVLIPLILISFKIYALILIKKGYGKNGYKKNRE